MLAVRSPHWVVISSLLRSGEGSTMRACLFAVVFGLFALSLHTCAQAQDAQQPRTASSKTEPDDVAEQLVVQVHGWFTNLAAQGKIPRVFTGISPDARQFIVELDSLTFDDVK